MIEKVRAILGVAGEIQKVISGPETREDQSKYLTKLLSDLDIFEKVKVSRWVRVWRKSEVAAAGIPYISGYIVNPDDAFLNSPERDQSMPTEDVYVVWFSTIHPEDRKESGLRSGWLTEEDVAAIKNVLPAGLAVNPEMSPGTPNTMWASDKSRYEDTCEEDKETGRRRGTFRIETDEVRRTHMKNDVDAAHRYLDRNGEAWEDLPKRLREEMQRIEKRYRDLSEEESTEK